MLWNPKHDLPAETKADPFSLDALIAWLETMNPAGEYEFTSTDNCVLCQYLRHVGIKRPRVTPSTWRDGLLAQERQLPLYWNEVGNPYGLFDGRILPLVGSKTANSNEGGTFGAALGRARALRAASDS